MVLVNYGIGMPGFSTEEVTSIIKHMEQIRDLPLPLWPGQHPSVRLQYLQRQQQSTPPAPQEVKKDEEIIAEKQEQQPLHHEEETQPQPLYQATVEDDNETTTESKSTLSTKARLCTAPASRDQAARLSKSPLFACQKAIFLVSSLTSFFGSFLTSFSASRFGYGYIRCMASMEASGEG